jgi:hypothetical protein
MRLIGPIDIIRVMYVSIKVRVRPTSKSVVSDAEVQHQRHRDHRIREVTSQLDVPTLLTTGSSPLNIFVYF